MSLVLASASPRRKDLLAQIGIEPSRIVAADIDETPKKGESPRVLAIRLARAKAEHVAAGLEKPDSNIDFQQSYILGADTVVALGSRPLGQAADEAEARKFLRMLSGRRHRVISALALLRSDGKLAERVVETVVAFAQLEDRRIESYLQTGEWRGKAGGYAIQGQASAFVRFLSGSYSGVVGLPLFETAQLLRGHGFILP